MIAYKELLKHMVEESISAIGGSTAVSIECNKNDAELVRKIVSDLQDSREGWSRQECLTSTLTCLEALE